MTYQDQIKSPKWQKKRLEVLNERRFACEECRGKYTQLHVHHSYYKKGKKIWEYENYELRCLCEDCHKECHRINDEILHALGMLEIVGDMDQKKQVLGYVHGMLGETSEKTPSESYMQGFIDGCSNYDIEQRFTAHGISLYWRGGLVIC